jgi:hypothetical protein
LSHKRCASTQTVQPSTLNQTLDTKSHMLAMQEVCVDGKKKKGGKKGKKKKK